MGMFDNLRKKAGKAVDQHGDKIDKGLDTAAQAIDKKTGHKHTDKIAKRHSQAKGALDNLDGKNDDFKKDGPPPR